MLAIVAKKIMDNQLKELLLKNCFEVFTIKPKFNLDLSELNTKLHQLQKKYHPDNWINNDLAVQALGVSAHINSCYTNLKKPLSRAISLLEINGYALDLAKNTSLPPNFLMEQMELHELIDEAGTSIDKLEALEEIISDKQESLSAELSLNFEQENYTEAVELTKQFGFYQRLLNSITDKITLTY